MTKKQRQLFAIQSAQSFFRYLCIISPALSAYFLQSISAGIVSAGAVFASQRVIEYGKKSDQSVGYLLIIWLASLSSIFICGLDYFCSLDPMITASLISLSTTLCCCSVFPPSILVHQIENVLNLMGQNDSPQSFTPRQSSHILPKNHLEQYQIPQNQQLTLMKASTIAQKKHRAQSSEEHKLQYSTFKSSC